MANFELSKEARNVVNGSVKEFGKAAIGLVNAAAGVALALQIERVDALSIPAARRPKVKAIQEAIRAEFGGLEKEGNRQAYDLCSLAFRVVAKMDKEAGAILAEGPAKGAKWGQEQVSALAGNKTVDAWRAWVKGEKTDKPQNTKGEQILAFFEKNSIEIGDDDLAKLAKLVNAALAPREAVAMELAARTAA